MAEAYVCVLHNGITGEVYNIGTQKERTVTAVANDIAKIFGLPTEKIVNVRDRAFNDRRYYICDNKLASLGMPQSTLYVIYANSSIDALNSGGVNTPDMPL